MMRKKYSGFIFVLLFLMAVVMTACSASKNSTGNTEDSKSDTAAPQERPEAGTSSGSVDGGEALTQFNGMTSSTSAEIQDKIIRRVNMDVETQKFDDLIDSIQKQIDKLGGYVENSEISGQSYYNSNDYRYGTIVARIPKEKLNNFVLTVKEQANVVRSAQTSENVTLEYTDMESRKKALEIEQDRLFAILEKSDSLDSIITLESRLSDIRYELQKYESQLRLYDNQVEYSSVTLSIQEVNRITPVSEEKQGTFSRIKTGFGNTVYQLSEAAKNFFVWFVVNLPYLIIWTLVILVLFLIGRRIWKKNVKPQIPLQGAGPSEKSSNEKEDK